MSAALRVMLRISAPNASRSISVAQRCDGAEGRQCFRGLRRQILVATRLAARGAELGLGASASTPPNSASGGSAPPWLDSKQRAERLVDAHAVFAHVEPHGAEAKGTDFAAQRQQQAHRTSALRRRRRVHRASGRCRSIKRSALPIAAALRCAAPRVRACAMVISIRDSMQARNWRKISPRLRAARASPSETARSACATASRKESGSDSA